ncbi:hypothetical protein [Streptomyces sp. MAR4 CNX-425]|uniref:hypothetical protein n=1 Tax=Streptomyces sp. MAR4 CNX-425 TaxID=3406343 RepID=UPI003B50508D
MHVDGGPTADNILVEAKWTGNENQWSSSQYNPEHRHYNQDRIIDQAERQKALAVLRVIASADCDRSELVYDDLPMPSPALDRRDRSPARMPSSGCISTLPTSTSASRSATGANMRSAQRKRPAPS